MAFLDNIEEKVKLGYQIFDKLMSLNDDALIEKLKSILNDESDEIFEILDYDKLTITRTIENMKPKEIFLKGYDSIIRVNWFGIKYKTDRRSEEQILVRFNKNFKL